MFGKLSKMCKKWLTDLNEELDTRSAKLDTGTTVKQFYFGANLFLVFLGIRIS